MNVYSLMQRRLVIDKLPYRYSWDEFEWSDVGGLCFSIVNLCAVPIFLYLVLSNKTSEYQLTDIFSLTLMFSLGVFSLYLFVKSLIKLGTRYCIVIDNTGLTFTKKALGITTQNIHDHINSFLGLSVHEETRYPKIEDFSLYGTSIFVVALIHNHDEDKNIVLYETGVKDMADKKAEKYAILLGLSVLNGIQS